MGERIFEIIEQCRTSSDTLKTIGHKIEKGLDEYLLEKLETNQQITEQDIKNLESLIIEIKQKFQANDTLQTVLITKVIEIIVARKAAEENTEDHIELKRILDTPFNNRSQKDHFLYLQIILSTELTEHLYQKISKTLKKWMNNNSKTQEKLEIMELLKKFPKEKLTEKDQKYLNYLIETIADKTNQAIIKSSKDSMKSQLERKVQNLEVVANSLEYLENNLQSPITKQQYQEIDNLLKYIENKIAKNSNKEAVQKLKQQINDFKRNLFKVQVFDSKIKQAIINGDITIPKDFPKNINISTKFMNQLESVTDKRIITIDRAGTKAFDGAFSIEKDRRGYRLTVYITDVPTFLMHNINLAREAYYRGQSIYLKDVNTRERKWNMIPSELYNNTLSLKQCFSRNAIEFTFEVDKNGKVYERSIDRKEIVVTNSLTIEQAKKVMQQEKPNSELRQDLERYSNLCRLMSKHVLHKSAKITDLSNPNNLMDSIVRYPSILVNKYIGEEADFAIYRANGVYTKEKNEKDPYTHSSSPLRNFVSNINLAFFLNQNGIVLYPEKHLHFVEDNIDTIIGHLNQIDSLAKLVEENPKFIRKYLK